MPFKPSFPISIFGRNQINPELPRYRHGKPSVHFSKGPVDDDSHQFRALKTTFDTEGLVKVENPAFVGIGWTLNWFLDEELASSATTGTWLVFEQDISFRAGEGVWLMTTSCIPEPRIVFEE